MKQSITKAPPIDRIGRVTSKSVEKCTGKGWAQWVEILDTAGGRVWTHQEIVAFLKKKHHLSLWWQQGVTTAYEIYIGRRIEGQSLKGDYSTVVTKTLPAAAKQVWSFLTSSDGQKLWLDPLSPLKFQAGNTYEVRGGIFGELRTMKAGVRARLSWQEVEWTRPSIVQLLVVPGKNRSCMVVLQHENLSSTTLKSKMHSHWKQALTRISKHFAGSV